MRLVRTVLRTLPLFFLTSMLMVGTFARADWPPVSKDELAYKSVPGYPDAPAVILFHEENDDDTLHFHQVYYRIKILTDAGRKYADVQIPYDKGGYNATDVKGRTTHADGTVVNFDGKPLDKEVLKGQGYKIHVKTITLPDVQVGSVIEYSYSWRYDDDTVIAPTWILQDDLFQKKAHYKFTPTTKEVVDSRGKPANGLAWMVSIPKGPEIKSFHDKYYELTMTDVPPFIEEDYMPPARAFKYHVNFYYHWATKRDDYWKEKGSDWYKSAEKFIGKDSGVKEATATLVQPSDTAEQKARKIYAFVQTLKNTSYLPEQTREELKAAGLKPNSGVQDVLLQKQGERDDITRLFVAMCRAAGLQSYLMWVTDRGENLFQPELLSTDQLDYEIAFVNIGGKELALDPGTKFAPFGTINWRYTGSQGLKQNPATGKAELAKSPAPTMGGDVIQRAGNFLVNDEGLAQGILLVRFYGQEALARRLRGSRTDAAGGKKLMEDEVKEWLPSNSDVVMTETPNWTDYEKPLSMQFKISAPILTRAGKRMLVAPDFLVANQPAMFTHTDRKQVVYFHHSMRQVDSISITIPASMQFDQVEPVSQLNTNYAAYKLERTLVQRTLTANRDFQMMGLAFRVENYPSLKAFYDRVKEYDDQPVLLRSAMNAQAN